LSQSATQSANGDNDVIDDDEPSATRQVAYTPPASQVAARSRYRRDVIDDSDDVEVIRNRGVGARGMNEIRDDAIDSTPPDETETETPGVLDADFDALFAPSRNGNKRRRTERSTPSASTKLTQADAISSSPPPTANPLANSIESPDLDRQNTTAWEMATQRTPAPIARPFAPLVLTPGEMKTPFRSRPRFMLSSTMKPPSIQSAPKFKPNTQTISPPERRKPVFVLPRSPSPNPDTENIPAPFSPSSRTLSRRGRNSAGVSNYMPGGMATEVRSWVLEMGTKREQFLNPSLARPVGSQTIHASEELGKYMVAARVIRVSHSGLRSCGPLAFLQAEHVAGQQAQEETPMDTLNIMIMGPPRSKPDIYPSSSHAETAQAFPLQEGYLIGILPGLTWNLELGDYWKQISAQNQSPNASLSSASLENDGSTETTKERWLVAMEWDLIKTHADS
jgi:hypothetical protein